jgi:hypothetical protein
MGSRTLVYCDQCEKELVEGTGMRETWVRITMQLTRLSQKFTIRKPLLDFCTKECMHAYFEKMYEDYEEFYED